MSSSLSTLFDEILDLRQQLGSPIRHLARPPLPKNEIAALFHSAGIRAPQILLDLYSITDGFNPQDEVRFIDDGALLPLEAAIKAFHRWKPILLEYEYPALFPITENEFGAGTGVLLDKSSNPDPPVLQLPLQCGTDQFYDSVTLMFATLAAWLRAGVKSAYDIEAGPLELERHAAITKSLNPKSIHAKSAA